MSDSRVQRRRRFLVCEPRHFAVQYAINPWMQPDTQVDVDLAQRAVAGADPRLPNHGHAVDTVEPVPGLPDMVFAANSAVVVGGRVFGSFFHAPERRPESTHYDTWFKAAGYDVHRPEAVCEGEGDLVWTGRYVLAGTGFRTTREAHREVQEFFGHPVISLTLVDPYFYHLDTALFVLDDGHEGNIVYYPEAFSPGSREVLARLYPDAVLATRDDAMAFGLNSVSDGRHVFIAPQAEALAARLDRPRLCPRPRRPLRVPEGRRRHQVLHPGDPLMTAPVRTRSSADLIRAEEPVLAHNYHPLPVVVARAEGTWVEDVEGRRYLDMLAGYSALNFGHRHPALIEAAHHQLDRLTLTSRAFHNDRLAEFAERLARADGPGHGAADEHRRGGGGERHQGGPQVGVRGEGRPRRPGDDRGRGGQLPRPYDDDRVVLHGRDGAGRASAPSRRASGSSRTTTWPRWRRRSTRRRRRC